MVRCNWMTRVHQWLGVPKKVVNVIVNVKLMEGLKNKMEVTEVGKVLTNRKINKLTSGKDSCEETATLQ